MQRKKGFTLVEIIVTFCLLSTISFLLFQLVISLKNLYTSNDYKTILLIEQGNMTRRINTDFFSMPLVSMEDCSTGDDKNLKKCYLFTLEDEVIETKVNKKLEIYTDRIVYDGYQMNVDNGSTMGDVSTVVSYIEDASVKYNCILTIDIPITNKLTEGDFGIHLSVQYNSITSKVPSQILDDYKKIEIVTTTISDIARKQTTTGDGLYTMVYEEWYDSKDKDQLKYVFRGEMPNNFVIYNKNCYRMIGITNDSNIKMIYEGEASEGRCNIVNTSGSIGKEEWGVKNQNNSWISTNSNLRNFTLPEWLNAKNSNKTRLSSSSSFYFGAVTSTIDTRAGLINEQKTNKGSSNLPNRDTYADHEIQAGLPMVSDYIFASLNAGCSTMIDATTTANCKKLNYLYKDYDYWTLNASANDKDTVWTVGATGMLETASITDKTIAIRPVLFLKSTTKFSGGGTTSNPYVVK